MPVPDKNTEEHNADRLNRTLKRYDTASVLYLLAKWLPAIAALYGVIKWIIEIVRCLTGGAYHAQLTSCTRLFSVEFLPRYYEPVFLCLTGLVFVATFAIGVVRFFRLAEGGKRIAVLVLLAVSLGIALPILFVLLVFPERFTNNFPYFMLNLSGIAAVVALVLAYFNKDVGGGWLFWRTVLWAALTYLGIPLLILLTQNAVLAVVVVPAGVVGGIILFTMPDPPPLIVETVPARNSYSKGASAFSGGDDSYDNTALEIAKKDEKEIYLKVIGWQAYRMEAAGKSGDNYIERSHVKAVESEIEDEFWKLNYSLNVLIKENGSKPPEVLKKLKEDLLDQAQRAERGGCSVDAINRRVAEAYRQAADKLG